MGRNRFCDVNGNLFLVFLFKSVLKRVFYKNKRYSCEAKLEHQKNNINNLHIQGELKETDGQQQLSI